MLAECQRDSAAARQSVSEAWETLFAARAANREAEAKLDQAEAKLVQAQQALADVAGHKFT